MPILCSNPTELLREGEIMTKMTPLECVEHQLAAYNDRDLDRFLEVFSDTVRTYRLPDMVPLLNGKPAFGAHYAANRFMHPGLHAELLSRVVVGNTVYDHELIHGIGPEPIETGVLFVIEDGLIETVFFIPAKTPS